MAFQSERLGDLNLSTDTFGVQRNQCKQLDMKTPESEVNRWHETYCRNLFKELKLLHIVVPFETKPIWIWFQTLPDFLWTAIDYPISLISAKQTNVTEQT